MRSSDIHALRERAKELRCLYRVDAIVSRREHTPAQAFLQILEAIPAGWQHPDTTGARITYLGRHYVGPGFSSGGQLLAEPVRLWDVEVGRIEVSDTASPAAPAGSAAPAAPAVEATGSPFLPEESELLRRIAGRIGEYLEWKHTVLFGDRTPSNADHWSWRQRFAQALADCLDVRRFGVERIFLGGSTALGNAGPGSDIDLYVVCTGSAAQRRELEVWLEGWSLCLAEVALQHTGQPFPGGILNVQWLDAAPDPARHPELRELTRGGG
ncbi:MAG: nucleotidyltransferase domain-containing protein [Gemmatimonadetes bacterium]|nr:nucleotidyltransferase domain-containing protein [Gemmatimonadota bacterium]